MYVLSEMCTYLYILDSTRSTHTTCLHTNKIDWEWCREVFKYLIDLNTPLKKSEKLDTALLNFTTLLQITLRTAVQQEEQNSKNKCPLPLMGKIIEKIRLYKSVKQLEVAMIKINLTEHLRN